MRRVLLAAAAFALAAGSSGAGWACGAHSVSAQTSTPLPVETAQSVPDGAVQPVPAAPSGG